MVILKFSMSFRVLSNSSLVSSSNPGSRASIIDFIAGRSERGSTGRKCFSRRLRNGPLTVRDAKDKVGAKPGRYKGRSLERPSFPMTENT